MIEQNESALDRRLVQAYKAATGVILADPSLIPEVQPWVADCPSPGLRAILEVVLDLYHDEDADIDAGAVMTGLGDNPVREHIPALEDFARQSDYSPRELLDICLAYLASYAHEAEKSRLQRRVGILQRLSETGDKEAVLELETTLIRLAELHRRGPSHD